jgi:hypothetical protein
MNDEITEIKRNLSALSDEELLRVVTSDRDQFRPEAIDLATGELNRRHVSINASSQHEEARNAALYLPPVRSLTYSLPNMWPGYVSAVAFLVAETVEAIRNPVAADAATFLTILIALSGWFYWVWCMRRVRMLITEAAGDPITTVPSGMRSFFGFHNLSWVIKWPTDVARFVNSRLGPGTINTRWTTTGLIAGLLLSRFDAAIGLLVVFSIGTYVRRRILAALGIFEYERGGLTRP